jgi:hypothetical protein
VEAVEPLGNSTVQVERFLEAERISDALCGRPRLADADDRAPWAAVLHADAPEAGTLRWLAGVLAVPATLVVVTAGTGKEESWEREVTRSGLSARDLALLEPLELPDGGIRFTAHATRGSHRVDVQARWDASVGGPVADEAGNCRIPAWIASRSSVPPSAPGAGDLGRPVPQIADGCRWWNGWRRCRQPRVLHVGRDGSVRPCWDGPAIGRVGDPFADLLARGRTLGGGAAADRDWRDDGCPMGGSWPGAAEREALEIASQLSWLGRRRMT